MNRGGLGARSLNIELQKVLNPPGEIRVERFGWTFCPGDKVMQIENDYDKEVYNGDLGIVSRIDLGKANSRSILKVARSYTCMRKGYPARLNLGLALAPAGGARGGDGARRRRI
jgi:ATP-dependent exoDNAse (exonuclease V) alpha subunit